jgi:3-oxoacyl-[acyl-carrier protein] reductase
VPLHRTRRAERRCTTDDSAEAIVFPGFGAAMLTGQTIVIDGGLTL